MEGNRLPLRFLASREQPVEHLRFLFPQHNAKGAGDPMLPHATRGIKLSVQLSEFRAQQRRYLFPHLQAQGFIASGEAAHRNDNHHI